jgi:hypothetical protein
MLEHFRRERAVRKAMHAIAKQRAVMFVEPGHVLVVEHATPDEEWFDVAVQTCLIRGWADVLHDAVPTGDLSSQGGEIVLPQSMTPKAMYRLTEGGWAAINRSHAWVIGTFMVALVTLVATVAPSLVALILSVVRLLLFGSA